jgi:hypothetical protein
MRRLCGVPTDRRLTAGLQICNRESWVLLLGAIYKGVLDGMRPMLLKNSLSGEKGGWAQKIDVHNRSVFDDLASG